MVKETEVKETQMVSKDYEIIILFSSREEVFKSSMQKVLEVFKEHSAKIDWEENIGIRPLAYRIKKHLTGHYYVFYLQVPPDKVKGLSRALNLQEDLLRNMLIAHDKQSLKYIEKRKKKRSYKKN